MRLALLVVGLAACGRVDFTAASDGTNTAGDSCAASVGDLVGSWSLDAIVGRTLPDRLGGAPLVIEGDLPTVVPGRIGNALDFSAVTVPTYLESPVLPPGAMTITGWFQNPVVAVDQAIAFFPAGTEAGLADRYDLWLNQDRIGALSLCVNAGQDECWGYTDDGMRARWVQFAAVIREGDETTSTLFVDGVAVPMACRFGDCSYTRAFATPFAFGSSDSEFTWRGQFDDLRVYRRALTASEISTVAACP